MHHQTSVYKRLLIAYDSHVGLQLFKNLNNSQFVYRLLNISLKSGPTILSKTTNKHRCQRQAHRCYYSRMLIVKLLMSLPGITLTARLYCLSTGRAGD